MSKIYNILVIFLFIFLCQCTNKNLEKESGNDNFYVIDKTDTEQINRKKAWKEVNKYKASITDTTFLQIKDKMSDKAIDPFNPNYAFNQVVYLKALERAKKFLIVRDNQLICSVESGKEILISEDLYQYIINVFDNWNKGIKENQYKIIKIDDGYGVEPITQE